MPRLRSDWILWEEESCGASGCHYTVGWGSPGGLTLPLSGRYVPINEGNY